MVPLRPDCSHGKEWPLQDTLATEPCWLLVPLHPRNTQSSAEVGVCVFWVYFSLFQAQPQPTSLHIHGLHSFLHHLQGQRHHCLGQDRCGPRGKAVLAGPGKKQG